MFVGRAGIALSIVKQSPNGYVQYAGIALEHCREAMEIDVYNAFVYGVYGMLLDRCLDKFELAREYLEYAIHLDAYQTRHMILRLQEYQDNDDILSPVNSAARLMGKSSTTGLTDDATGPMHAQQGSRHVKFAAGTPQDMERRRAQQLMEKINQFKFAQLHMWYAMLLANFEDEFREIELKIERKHKKAIARAMKKAKEAHKKANKAKSKTKLVPIGSSGSDDGTSSPGRKGGPKVIESNLAKRDRQRQRKSIKKDKKKAKNNGKAEESDSSDEETSEETSDEDDDDDEDETDDDEEDDSDDEDDSDTEEEDDDEDDSGSDSMGVEPESLIRQFSKFQTQLRMQAARASQHNGQQALGSGALKRQSSIALLGIQSAKLEQMYSTIPDNLISGIKNAKLKTFMKSAFGPDFYTNIEIISDSPEKHFTRALQVYPKCSIFHSNYGLYLITEERYEAAIKHLNYSVQFDRKNVCALSNLAWLYCLPEYANFEDAKLLYKEALKLKSKDAIIHASLGRLLCHVYDDYKTAKQHYLAALMYDKKNPHIHYYYALLWKYYERNDEEAHRFVSNSNKFLYRASKFDADSYIQNARILMNRGKFGPCKFLLKRAKDLNPSKKRQILNILKELNKMQQAQARLHAHQQRLQFRQGAR